MITNRLTLVTLAVDDPKRSRAYYEALGWVLEEDLGPAVFYDMDGMKFGLFTRAGLAKETGREVQDLGTGAMSLSQNFPTEAEVDQMFDRAVRAGAAPVRAPFKTDWGGYSSYVSDPDGHLWEFAHNPFWALDEKGRIA